MQGVVTASREQCFPTMLASSRSARIGPPNVGERRPGIWLLVAEKGRPLYRYSFPPKVHPPSVAWSQRLFCFGPTHRRSAVKLLGVSKLVGP